MVDFLLDRTTNDMVVTGGKLAEISDPVELAKQRASVALQTHRGEWLFDNEHGLPFTEEILVKAPNLDQIAARVRAYILTLEGFIGVTQCALTLDREERRLHIDLNAEIPEGLTGPFRVTVGL